MALSINIDGNSYELTGVDHPAEEETVRKLISTIEKYAKDDKDLKTKLLKEFKDQLDTLNKTSEDILKKTQTAARPAATTTATSTAPAQAAAATTKAFNSASNAAGTSSKVLGNLTTNAGFASNAIQSMNSGLQTTTGGLGMLSKVVPVVGGVLSGLASAAGFAVTSIVSLGTAALGAFTEAARYQGDMAKQGVAFTGSLQSLAYAAGRSGMTLEEFSNVIKSNSTAISALGRTGQTGVSRFATLITAARNSADSLRGLGFSAAEEAQARADFVDIIKAQGSAESLRTMTDGQIINSSTKMVKGFMGVAAVTGKTVDELLKKTKELAADDDVRLTLEALNVPDDVRRRIASNFTVLETMGLGSLKDVYLEMQTFGVGIGEAAMGLHSLGIGPQVENFLRNLDKLDPAEMQIEMIKFAKTLNTQQIANISRLAQIDGPARSLASALIQAKGQSVESVRQAQREAETAKQSVAAAQAFNEAMNQLKSQLTGVLLAIAESQGFQAMMRKLTEFIKEHGELISQRLGKLGEALYNFVGLLVSPTGRQQIINDFRDVFTDILIGIKKETLGRIGMYSEEDARLEKQAASTRNIADLERTRAFEQDPQLAAKESALFNERIKWATETNQVERQKIADRIATLQQEIEARKATVIANDQIAQETEKTAVAAETAAAEVKHGLGTLAVGILAGAGILAVAWATTKNLIVKGVERALLGGGAGGGLLRNVFSRSGTLAQTAAASGPRQDASGRWRDAGGRFTAAPAGRAGGAQPLSMLAGIGPGIEGILKGLAAGFTAFANPKVILGAAGFGTAMGAIVIQVGAAAAGAMWLIGKALPTFSKGLESLNRIDGANLVKVGAGLAAFAGGLAVFGVGSALAGVGSLIGTISDSIGKLMGGQSMMDKFIEFSRLDIDAARVKENSEALASFGLAMAALGGAQSIAGIAGLAGYLVEGVVRFFGGSMIPYEELDKFNSYSWDANKVKGNAEAVIAFTRAMVTANLGKYISGFANLAGNLANGIVSFFGGTSGEIPVEEMMKFARLEIPAQKIKANAEAVAAWATAIAAMPSDVGVRKGGVWGAMKDFFLGEEGGDFPWDKLISFGNLAIPVEGVKTNAEAVSAFAKAVSEMPTVTTRTGGVWGFIKEIWSGEATDIDWYKMVEFGNIKMPVEGIKTNAEAVRIFAEAIERMPEITNVRKGGIWSSIKSFFVGDETEARPWKILEEFGAVVLPLETIKNNSQAIAEFAKAMDIMPRSAGGSAFFEGLINAFKSGVFSEESVSSIDNAIVKFDRLKASMSYVSQAANGEFVLKPIDIALYDQLNQTLEQTKGQINTTFSQKTYEQTFKTTVATIDATYNVKTSKLQETLNLTRQAIKDTFTPPYQELKKLSDAIIDAVKTATNGVTSPDGGGGTFDLNSFLAKTAELESGGGRNLRPVGLTGAPTIAGKYHMSDAARADAFSNLGAADRARLALKGFVRTAPKHTDLLDANNRFKPGMEEVDEILARSLATNMQSRLSKKLGREATNADMRGAWWHGEAGYMKLLRADPNAQVSSVLEGGDQQFKGRTVAQQLAYIANTMGSRSISPIGGGRTPLPADGSLATAGGTLRTGAGFKQLRLDEKGRIVDESGKESKSGTLTAVSSEEDTQEKILNMLEQTYNLHADKYQKDRFKGFTAFTGQG